MNARRAEHDQLRKLMVRFSDLMDTRGATGHGEMIRQRLLFSQAFTSHLAHEQAEVEQLSRMSAALAGKAKARGKMIADLRGDYGAHVRHWTPARIRDDWADYREAVLALQSRLLQFMRWEEDNLPLYA